MAAPAGLRWSRVLALLIVVLAAAEAASRIAIELYVGAPFRSFDGYSFSGYGVYRQNPRYTHRAFHHNSVGFRSEREYTLDKPPKTLRIMAIGASVLYAGAAATPEGAAARIRTDETITAYLQTLLDPIPELAGYRVEVINASVNRHRLRDVLSYWVAELARYEPDIVLVFGTNNDARHIEIQGGGASMFRDMRQPTPEDVRLERLANEASLGALAEKAVRVAVNRSALAALAYRVLDRALQVASAAMAAAGAGGAPPEPEVLASSEERAYNLRVYLAALGALVTHIDLIGAQPIVFWEYLLLNVEDIKPLSPYERRQAAFMRSIGAGLSEERKRIKFEIRDRTAAFLASRGIPMLDIEADLRRYDGTLFNDYLHYTAEGNRWVAERVAASLGPYLRDWVARQGAPETAPQAGP